MASGMIESSSQGSGESQGPSRTKLVQRLLNASASLPQFIEDLLRTQAHTVAGTEAAGFVIERNEGSFALRPIAHIREDNSDEQTRARAVAAFQEIVKPCVEQGKDGAVEIGSPDGGDAQYCLVTLLRSEGEIVAVSAVVTRCRSIERAKQRLMSMQLVAGYFEFYTLRRSSEQTKLVAQSHQHVLQLATAVATAEGFESAAMNLCNELAARTGATRVSLGWIKGNRVRVKALSHTEKFDKKQELIVDIEAAMEECWDQEEPVQYDPEGENSPNVTRAAQALSRQHGGNMVLCLPLRRQAEIVGIATLEFLPKHKPGAQAATGLSIAIDLLAPQLYDRYQNDRWLITKAGISARETWKAALGPKHWIAKSIAIFSLAAVLFLVLYSPMYRVKAGFTLTPIEKVAVSAPFEGVISRIHVKADDDVQQGDVLIELDTAELHKNLAKAIAQIGVHQQEEHMYRAEEGKTADAQIARMRRREAEAEAARLQYLIDRSTVRAPIAGKVLIDNVEFKRDAPVKQGDVLFELGEPGKLRVEIDVNERDIQNVREGSKGHLATTSMPGQKIPFSVERIVPMGVSSEGTNVFKVYATPERISQAWFPGLMGEARIDVEPRPLIWIWTHRVIDFVRLKLWL